MKRGGLIVMLSGLVMAFILAFTARTIILNSTNLTDSENTNLSGSFLHSQDMQGNIRLIDKAEPNVKIDPDGIDLGFMKPAKGKVTLINIGDENQNRSFQINSGKKTDIKIPLPGISSGQWKIQFEYESDGKNYFYEEDAFLK